MSAVDPAARWTCLALDLAELLEAAKRLRIIARDCAEDLTQLAAMSTPQPSELQGQSSASLDNLETADLLQSRRAKLEATGDQA